RRGLLAGGSLADARDLLGRELVWVAPIAQRPAQHAARSDADERVAAHALSLLGGLQQEGRLFGRELTQLQEGRDGCLAVIDEAMPQRDQVVLLPQLTHLGQARLDAWRLGQLVSDCAHPAPARRRRVTA